MSRLVIFANPDKPEAPRLAAEAEREASAMGVEVFVSTRLDDALDRFRPDLAAVFGGDGTVLAAIAGLGDRLPPIIAFNLGRLGYLANNPPEHTAELIRDALLGRLRTSPRIMIEARLLSAGKTWTRSALNEFILTPRQRGRQLPLSVWVDGEELFGLRGDGIIVATPTGSTAYALSAGGPVASPELPAIILAPICPHQLSNRSLVLGPDEVVRIRHFSDKAVELLTDGRFSLDMEKDDILEVKASPIIARFLSPAAGRYQLLREKLGWGWCGGKEEHAKNQGSA
ncbi:MAG: NAD(+)/NADH kinase [Planctomycetes bacterium]|nr:NAD(+)/NADH kinase [Planctomycetota bacterium]